MQIVRYHHDGSVRVGVHRDGQVRPLAVESLARLWRLPLAQLPAALHTDAAPVPLARVRLLAPVDGRTEVWACGVTYEISRAARVEESERAATVYEQVYDADRPELFFKSAAWRVRGPGEPIGIRADSTVDVPEPELALVVNALGETVGYTVCNDVSSRSIEGENPLYLPQAKIYQGACALGPWVTPVWEVADPYDLAMELVIDGRWTGRASTAQLHRRLDDLVGYLLRGDEHPDGVVLSTGTCLVPAAPFTLVDGDVVRITLDGVGTLANPVRRGLTRPPTGERV